MQYTGGQWECNPATAFATIILANMKIKYVLFAIVLLTASCATTRTYVPNFISQTRASIYLNKPVLFSVEDQRSTPEDRDEVIASMTSGLMSIYPHALKNVEFFEKQPDSTVKVTISIKDLTAQFGVRLIDQGFIYSQNSTAVAAAGGPWSSAVAAASSSQTFISNKQAQGHWVGTAHLEVTVTDKRGAKREFTVPLVGEDDEPNTWGYASASTANEKAWRIVEQGLVSVMDKIVLNVRDGNS